MVVSEMSGPRRSEVPEGGRIPGNCTISAGLWDATRWNGDLVEAPEIDGVDYHRGMDCCKHYAMYYRAWTAL